jgi:hypothetical protein
VEWGGIELAVVPPPPGSGPADAQLEAVDRLPDGPILYYITRDSTRAMVVPVGEITDDGMARIETGDDPEAFGTRFIAAFLRQGSELTLFRGGRRAGTLIVDSAAVPAAGPCRRLPSARGHLELSGAAGDATEFLAMARTQAPEGRMLPGGALEPDRRMQVMGPILAERALRARSAQLPNWSLALRQIQPFPVSEARDPGFTATFLVDDELQVGNDDQGYSLFIVYTPQAQSGYDTAYVQFVDYPRAGKAAPRTIDFLDWDRDGSVELLLETFGVRDRWFQAVGKTDDRWRRILDDRCDAPPTAVAADSVAADSAAAGPATPRLPVTRPPATDSPRPRPRTQQAVPDLEPQVRLSVPGRPAPAPRDTQPDTAGGGAPPRSSPHTVDPPGPRPVS